MQERRRRRRPAVALLTVLGALSLALPVAVGGPAPPVAQAAEQVPDHEVQVSAVYPERETFHFAAYYPQRLQVHQGDVVRWKFLDSYAGWHSVTFSPGDMDVSQHPEPRYPEELFRDGAWGLDETGKVKIPDRFALGSPDGFLDEPEPCGRGVLNGNPAQGPCTLSSTDQLIGSSVSDTFVGMENGTAKRFDLQVDLEPGTYRYHCMMHPAMVGEVEVLPADQALDPYTEEERAADIAADVAAAWEVVDRFADPQDAYDPETGEWTVNVTEATDDGRVIVNEFLPGNLEIEAGDKVNFVMGGEVAGSNEPNTVTFPAAIGGGFCVEGTPTKCSRVGKAGGVRPMGGTAFIWGCDPDDPNAGVPLLPFSWSVLRRCPDGTTLEWVLTDYMSHSQRAPGNQVASPATFHNSGVMVPASSPDAYRNRGDGTQFPSQFEAEFPSSGDFPYVCIAHPDYMKGSIRVSS